MVAGWEGDKADHVERLAVIVAVSLRDCIDMNPSEAMRLIRWRFSSATSHFSEMCISPYTIISSQSL